MSITGSINVKIRKHIICSISDESAYDCEVTYNGHSSSYTEEDDKEDIYEEQLKLEEPTGGTDGGFTGRDDMLDDLFDWIRGCWHLSRDGFKFMRKKWRGVKSRKKSFHMPQLDGAR